MEKVRVGIVGCGNMGTGHGRNFLDGKIPDGYITAVCDIEPKKFQFFKEKFGDKIAVGADVKNGFIAIKGWLENSTYKVEDFFAKMEQKGVKTIICTDISKDGAMKGTNLQLYKELKKAYNINVIASGGVSDISDVKNLKENDIYGAIIGKAYYVGAIDLVEAIEVANDN